MLPPVLQHYRQAAEPGLQWRQTQEHERRPTQVKYIFILLTVFPFGWPTLMPHLQWFPIFRHSKPIFIQYKVNSIEAAAVSATLYCRCDPPCVPYLGIYLSDLTYIEEGTANFTESGLVNFAKMRMVNRTIFIWSPGWKKTIKIAHVIREVRQFQQTPYKIDPIQKASDYLLDPTRMLTDDEMYEKSLMIEPRSSRLSVSAGSYSVGSGGGN